MIFEIGKQSDNTLPFILKKGGGVNFHFLAN